MGSALRPHIPRLRDSLHNLLLYFAAIGIAAGLGFAFLVPRIGEGNGILAATFFGVTGYIITQLYEGLENREAVAIACYATVKSQYVSAVSALGGDALEASRQKSLAIARGELRPSFGRVAPDPYRFLPSEPTGIIRELRAETIELLGDWYVQDQELGIYWETLETAEFAAIGKVRINNYYDLIKQHVWPDYQQLTYRTLHALAGELPRQQLAQEVDALFRASDE